MSSAPDITSQDAEVEPNNRADIGLILGRVAVECADLAEAVDRLQTRIGELMETGNVMPDAGIIRDLQDADRISQTLRSFARLNSEAGKQLSGTEFSREDVARAIALESVAHRLLE